MEKRTQLRLSANDITGASAEQSSANTQSKETLAYGSELPPAEESEPAELRYEADVAAFQEFREQYRSGTLPPQPPVKDKIDYWAQVVARRNDCMDLWRDLAHEAFVSLGEESAYAGKCSLDRYIVVILESKVWKVKQPPVRGHFKYVHHDEETKEKFARRPLEFESLDAEDANLTRPELRVLNFEQVMRKLGWEECMAKLLTLSPLHRLVVAIILSEEGNFVTDRRIAQEATSRMRRKVTRYEVSVVLKQLRPVFAQLRP